MDGDLERRIGGTREDDDQVESEEAVTGEWEKKVTDEKGERGRRR